MNSETKNLPLISLMLNNNIIQKFDELFVFVTSLGFKSAHILNDKQKDILLTAFVHKSYASDFVPALSHNERLEFLGDSILGACIGSLLYTKYPEWSEAQMTLYKIALVREETLAKIARQINLGKHLFLSKGEEKQQGREKDSILSDGLEGIIGAGYLIYGFDEVYSFISSTIRQELQDLIQTDCKSYKSLIQERAQGKGLPLPSYHSSQITKDGDPWFHSELKINDISYGTGSGKNKKRSQEDAAKDAYLNKEKHNG